MTRASPVPPPVRAFRHLDSRVPEGPDWGMISMWGDGNVGACQGFKVRVFSYQLPLLMCNQGSLPSTSPRCVLFGRLAGHIDAWDPHPRPGRKQQTGYPGFNCQLYRVKLSSPIAKQDPRCGPAVTPGGPTTKKPSTRGPEFEPPSQIRPQSLPPTK